MIFHLLMEPPKKETDFHLALTVIIIKTVIAIMRD